jgi:hypothetical protein
VEKSTKESPDTDQNGDAHGICTSLDKGVNDSATETNGFIPNLQVKSDADDI